MANGYSWSEVRGGRTYRLPGPEHLGWWATVAMLLSILLHVAVFFALDHMKIALKFEQARELNTGSIQPLLKTLLPFFLPRQAFPFILCFHD